jgi:rubrerythrin
VFTAHEIFDLAIQVEENGERFYGLALSKSHREPLRELLKWLAAEEVKHKETFRLLQESLSDEDNGPVPAEHGMDLRAAMGRHAFSLDEAEISSMEDEQELLQTAIEFESDSILFYEFIASLITGARALAAIQAIRAQEMDHKRLLMERVSRL